MASEVIHALDIIQHINGTEQDYHFEAASGTHSDFSISGDTVLDSVMLTARLGASIITGYSSFVNILRKREIDLTFIAPNHKLIYTKLIFDTPEWDVDYLRLWEDTKAGVKIHLELNTKKRQPNPQLKTIEKLSRLVHDVFIFIKKSRFPKQKFPDLMTAIRLQKQLNHIESMTKSIGPVTYVAGVKRELLVNKHDLERLG